MRTYKVVLCDHEEMYVLALMNYMNRMTQIPVISMAFTNVNEMYAYLKDHKVDLIITECTPNGMEDTVNQETKIIHIFTTEEQVLTEKYNVFKYSPALEYVRKMLQVFSEEEQTVQSDIGGTSIAVYSPHGRSGKTMLAKALSEYYSRQCVKKTGVVYLGMEEYGCQAGDDHAMEELLYYIKQKVANISMKLKALAVNHYGYDMVAANGSYEELRDLNISDIQWFIESVIREGLYERVVVDIGSGSLSNLDILQYFNVVYIPILHDSVSVQKWKTFCKTLQTRKIDEINYNQWYPVYIDKDGLSDQEIRELENKREQGELRSMIMEIQETLQGI